MLAPDQTVGPNFDCQFREDLETLFRWRRDERHFRCDPLPEGLLDRLLELADMAPSVGNCQPWRFVIVRSSEARARVIETFETANAHALSRFSGTDQTAYAQLKLAGLRDAPEHLAVFCDPEPAQGRGLGRSSMPETVTYSAVGAIHALWLAARAHGLGLGWVSILDPVDLVKVLDVSAEWQFIGYFCLGYPVAAHDRPELERVGWQARTPLADRVVQR